MTPTRSRRSSRRTESWRPGRNRWPAEAPSASAASSRRFRLHLAANPVVDLDGDRARGWWHVLVAVTGEDGAAWLAGRYKNEFVRTEDGWRFASLRFHRVLHAPYAVGWSPPH